MYAGVYLRLFNFEGVGKRPLVRRPLYKDLRVVCQLATGMSKRVFIGIVMRDNMHTLGMSLLLILGQPHTQLTPWRRLTAVKLLHPGGMFSQSKINADQASEEGGGGA